VTMVLDILGRPFDFDAPPRRVVSLVPSLTETLFDLGAGDAVAGITDFCIFPAGLALPRVGGTKNPRVAEIRALEPDVVYMNLEENLRRHAEEIETFAPVFVTEPKSVDDVAALIATLGEIHRCDASALLRELDAARFTTEPFTFAVPIWKSPWMWCGGDTYVSALVESVGGRNVLRDRERYPSLGVEDVLVLKPDIVFLPDEPYAFTPDDALALRGPRVVGPFPGHLFTWHGTRTILGLHFLRTASEERRGR
jgi:ABC-type Fe3+-hydroxamate transport system substrate-binding protein